MRLCVSSSVTSGSPDLQSRLPTLIPYGATATLPRSERSALRLLHLSSARNLRGHSDPCNPCDQWHLSVRSSASAPRAPVREFVRDKRITRLQSRLPTLIRYGGTATLPRSERSALRLLHLSSARHLRGHSDPCDPCDQWHVSVRSSASAPHAPLREFVRDTRITRFIIPACPP